MTAAPNSASATNGSGPDARPRDGLASISFIALLLTQLLTAINDNVFRWLAIGVGKDYVNASNIGMVLMAGTACFVIPYLVLAAPAGYLADRFSKRNVIVGCKFAEIIIMSLGVCSIAINVSPQANLVLLFTAVALMGAQSALFSPSKMGSIPELLRADKISAANGLFGLATVSATVIGMAIGSWLSRATGFRGKEDWWISAVVLLSIASVGLLLSLMIRQLPIADPKRRFPWDAARQTWRDLRALASNRALLRVALGVVFFWSVGALAQLNVDQFAFEGGALYETDKVPLLFALVIGVGFGSVLAGVWSGGRIELGILPLGAFGVSVCSMLLFTVAGGVIEPSAGVTGGLVWAMLLLFLLGASAGLFSVPLEAYMQHRSPPRERGSILAAMNFLVFLGILLSALLFAGLRRPTFPGSLENIPHLQDRLAQLPADQEANIQSLVSEFEQRWAVAETAAPENGGDTQMMPTGEPTAAEQPTNGASVSPSLTEYVARVDPGVRDVALAQLVWVELKARQDRGEFLSKDEYFELFDDVEEKQLFKDVFDQASDLPLLTARQIFLVAGVFTIPVFLYILFLIPQSSVRFLVWLASHTAYRIRIFGHANLPERGGALLVANHVSWLDGILLLLVSSRQVRILAFTKNLRGRWIRWFAKLAGVILVTPGSKEIQTAFEAARKALADGELVGIFPEGGMTRSGIMQAFRPSVMRIQDGTNAPVIPVYLDELWGSIFSFEGGRYFWKIPRKWPYPISIHIGNTIKNPQDIYQVRQAVQFLGATAVQQRAQKMPPVTVEFIRTCKRRRRQPKVADSSGAELNGGSLLMRTLILRRLLRRELLADDEQNVGVLLPPTVPAVVTNAALTLDGRVAVNLNYTVSKDVLQACIDQAEIRHVLTSRQVVDKLGIKLDAELVMLEDYRDKVALADKIAGFCGSYLVPANTLAKSLGLYKKTNDDLMTLVFTSGSTGQPKGVMLSYGNIGSNVEAVRNVVRIDANDVLLGILPFFHSFGYTITMWTVLSIDAKGVYHFNPLDAQQVSKLCQKHGVTILLSTPTFLRSYLRRCKSETFKTANVVVTGAEKLPPDVADAFEAKFGVRPIEGYGCTETAPLACVNVPPSRSQSETQLDRKEGTVGRPVPGVTAKTIDLETGEDLGVNQTGMILIKGPNIMMGYLKMPELTAEVIRDGWYVTGDVGLIDEDGFIKITGRESRFSKIGGEMVPHIQIEEQLAQLIGHAEDGFKAAVTAVPDHRKGERLIVVHTSVDKSPHELCIGLKEAGLPNIYIPSPDSFMHVDELPVLGTGKLDLKRVREMARDRFGKDDV
jgi:acyl-[acyl-carrier-protein]-phospholipid O-acyltransferase/long-chain-fatty-acid--[acyl-carrier-protein] ligase